MKRIRMRLNFLLVLTLLPIGCVSPVGKVGKICFFFIGDGMGVSQVASAEFYESAG